MRHKRKYYIPTIIHFLMVIILSLLIIILTILFSFSKKCPSILLQEPFHPVVPTQREQITKIPVRVSYYQPWLGGTNCSDFENGICISKTASGEPWQDWMEYGAACPPEWDFGTRFTLPDDSTWACIDRGGQIQIQDGIAWVDLLTENPKYSYGSIQMAQILELK